MQLVETKVQVVEFPQQLCSTRDNKHVYVTPVLYYRIVDAYKATFKVVSLQDALEQRVLTTLEHILRQRTQESLLGGLDCMLGISQHIILDMALDAASWGVEVQEILIKEFKFAKDPPTRATLEILDHMQGHAVNVNVIENVKNTSTTP